jgi:hypothetical protein
MIAVVFYCFAVNDWESRLTRQIEKLHSSGLYERADELHFFVTDPNKDKKNLIQELLKNSSKIEVNYTDQNHYEFLALNKVDQLARERDCNILYFHTKGVWNNFKNYQTQELDILKIDSIHSWVGILEHYLIDNWEKCIEKLETFDTVGVTNYGNWWWGNFWWTKSSHIRKNIPFLNFCGSRWTAEAWLHAANDTPDNIKYYEFFHFNFDPLYSTIPKYFYDNTDISSIKFNIIEASYGYFANQRDEGSGLPSEDDSIVDVTEKVKQVLKDKQEDKNFHLQLSDVSELVDLTPTVKKVLRVKYSTNIDPKNQYTITSFFNYLSILPTQ